MPAPGLPGGAPISIHAPREGSDRRLEHSECHGYEFQSTLPARGATAIDKYLPTVYHISIHAPREGSDVQTLEPGTQATAISIHAPREGSDEL